MDRIRKMPREAFLPLEQAYLSTYDIYSTVHSLEECSAHIVANVPAVHLMEFARQHWGVNVLGVTSERRSKDGSYICARRNVQTGAVGCHKIVYTGRYNYFSNTKASVWATKRSDTCYYNEDEWSDELTFVELL